MQGWKVGGYHDGTTFHPRHLCVASCFGAAVRWKLHALSLDVDALLRQVKDR